VSTQAAQGHGGANPPKAKSKVGLGWKALVVLAALALAAFLLYRTLSRYSLDELVASVAAIPASRLLAAGGFAAASYACLTGFDYLALRSIGKTLPYPKVALASFCGLSLGHNIGLAAASSGAVRYRFYSRWGLSAGDIARVIVFCGLTVGLGLLTLGGAAILLRTDLATEITGLSVSLLLAVAAGCLGLVAGYLALAAFLRRPLKIRKWSLDMPPLHLALGQVAIGALNFSLVAACLHQALAAVADVGYLGVASVYVIANATAIFSHVPGGLGVIESVVMYLMPGVDLIGPLLVFRFVYFLMPLALGATLFLAAELTFRLRDRKAGHS
jgi:uncharacterized membrane protein YbhN (UPF0104 family)